MPARHVALYQIEAGGTTLGHDLIMPSPFQWMESNAWNFCDRLSRFFGRRNFVGNGTSSRSFDLRGSRERGANGRFPKPTGYVA